jgi:predicted nucleic acid-binding protein
MNAVFVDIGYLLALELANDINHAAALAHWRRVTVNLPPLLTTSLSSMKSSHSSTAATCTQKQFRLAATF